jgi:sulfite reductase alpha subunit-like flavoprotein
VPWLLLSLVGALALELCGLCAAPPVHERACGTQRDRRIKIIAPQSLTLQVVKHIELEVMQEQAASLEYVPGDLLTVWPWVPPEKARQFLDRMRIAASAFHLLHTALRHGCRHLLNRYCDQCPQVSHASPSLRICL